MLGASAGMWPTSMAHSCSFISWKRTNLDPRVCIFRSALGRLSCPGSSGGASRGQKVLPAAQGSLAECRALTLDSRDRCLLFILEI